MPTAITERIKVIDVATHITEPADVWTSRLSKKWGTDRVPHVEEDPEDGKWYWMLGGQKGQQPIPPSRPRSRTSIRRRSGRGTASNGWTSMECTPR